MLSTFPRCRFDSCRASQNIKRIHFIRNGISTNYFRSPRGPGAQLFSRQHKRQRLPTISPSLRKGGRDAPVSAGFDSPQKSHSCRHHRARPCVMRKDGHPQLRWCIGSQRPATRQPPSCQDCFLLHPASQTTASPGHRALCVSVIFGRPADLKVHTRSPVETHTGLVQIRVRVGIGKVFVHNFKNYNHGLNSFVQPLRAFAVLKHQESWFNRSYLETLVFGGFTRRQEIKTRSLFKPVVGIVGKFGRMFIE